MNKTRIYEDLKDLHVKGIVLYAKSADDNYLYTDAAYTNKVTSEELRDMFVKGMIIKCDKSSIKPVCFADDYNGGVAVGGFDPYSGESSLTLKMFISAEATTA